MGKSTISMAIFNCYVSSPEGTQKSKHIAYHQCVQVQEPKKTGYTPMSKQDPHLVWKNPKNMTGTVQNLPSKIWTTSEANMVHTTITFRIDEPTMYIHVHDDWSPSPTPDCKDEPHSQVAMVDPLPELNWLAWSAWLLTGTRMVCEYIGDLRFTHSHAERQVSWWPPEKMMFTKCSFVIEIYSA